MEGFFFDIDVDDAGYFFSLCFVVVVVIHSFILYIFFRLKRERGGDEMTTSQNSLARLGG